MTRSPPLTPDCAIAAGAGKGVASGLLGGVSPDVAGFADFRRETLALIEGVEDHIARTERSIANGWIG